MLACMKLVTVVSNADNSGTVWPVIGMVCTASSGARDMTAMIAMTPKTPSPQSKTWRLLGPVFEK